MPAAACSSNAAVRSCPVRRLAGSPELANWVGPVRDRVSVPRGSLRTILPVARPALLPTVVIDPEIAKKPERRLNC